jgi:predicted RNase H-like HicB family nuclease
MNQKLQMTIAYEEPDEKGWIVARVVEVPGAMSQGRTREEARENVVDALAVMLAPDDDGCKRRGRPTSPVTVRQSRRGRRAHEMATRNGIAPMAPARRLCRDTARSDPGSCARSAGSPTSRRREDRWPILRRFGAVQNSLLLAQAILQPWNGPHP